MNPLIPLAVTGIVGISFYSFFKNPSEVIPKTRVQSVSRMQYLSAKDLADHIEYEFHQ
jgi:hypothetical protein